MNSKKIYLATKNPNKINELQRLLGNNWDVQSIDQLPSLSWDETGLTFEDNAKIKVEAVSQHTNELILGDDSGLEVDALDGRPGVHSSRYAGVDGDNEANNKKLLEELGELEAGKRSARFVCCLCFLDEKREWHFFKGTCEGFIGDTEQGVKGFGYDPLFYPLGHDRSFAEMSPSEKNEISHRANALREFINFVSNSR